MDILDYTNYASQVSEGWSCQLIAKCAHHWLLPLVVAAVPVLCESIPIHKQYINAAGEQERDTAVGSWEGRIAGPVERVWVLSRFHNPKTKQGAIRS